MIPTPTCPALQLSLFVPPPHTPLLSLLRFDDLALAVKQSSWRVGAGLALAGLFIGVGMVGSSILSAYLEHVYFQSPRRCRHCDDADLSDTPALDGRAAK